MSVKGKNQYTDECECQIEQINLRLTVKDSIVSLYAHTVFFHPSGNELHDAVFEFPLDCNAAIYDFRAKIDARIVLADCFSRTEALETYAETKSPGQSTAVMMENFNTYETFVISLGHIKQHAIVEVELVMVASLDIIMEEDGPKYSFTVPSVLSPRQNSIDSAYRLTFSGEITTGWKLASLSGSTQDKFETKFADATARKATFELISDFKMDHDLNIEFHFDGQVMLSQLANVGVIELGDVTRSKKEFLALNVIHYSILPCEKSFLNLIDYEKLIRQPNIRNDITFIIDLSESMEGRNIFWARQSLDLLIASRPQGCRFQVIACGLQTEQLFSMPVEYSEVNVRLARAFAKCLEPSMTGSDVLCALQIAFNARSSGQGWHKQIILLTDGEISNSSQVCSLVSRHAHQARVFAIGFGCRTTKQLLNGIARAGNGKAVFVRTDKDLHSASMQMLNFALQTRLSDVKLAWSLSGKSKKAIRNLFYTIPAKLPPVYLNEPWHCFAIYTGKCDESTIGQVSGQLSFRLNNSKNDTRFIMKPQPLIVAREEANQQISRLDGHRLSCFLVHRLAAKLQIQELSDQWDNSGLDKEKQRIENRIKEISIQSKVLSRFTGFAAVDKASPTQELTAGENTKRPTIIRRVHYMPTMVLIESMDCCCSSLESLPSTFQNTSHYDNDHAEVFSLRRKNQIYMDAGNKVWENAFDLALILAELQNTDGSWDMTNRLLQSLQRLTAILPESQLLNVIPRNCSWSLFITLCCLQALKFHASAIKDHWTLFARKALVFVAGEDVNCQATEIKIIIKERCFDNSKRRISF